MPSDPRVHLALERLAPPIADFRSIVVGALAQAEGFVASVDPDDETRVATARAALGPFAEGRIDARALVALTAERAAIPAAYRDRLDRAVAVLRDVLERGVALHVVDVPSGTSLVAAVEGGLARAGRAFGAVLAVELMKGGRYRGEEHDGLLDQLAFRSWTRVERRFAPPLVVLVDGTDLHIGGLADFLDGREKIVLVVRGACPPAPLARLITPRTLVLQTLDDAGLEQVANSADTAVAAMVPDGCALFLHDPGLGREAWQRMSIWNMPRAPRQSLGGMSVWQMEEDLRHLTALAAGPVAAGPVAAGESTPRAGGAPAPGAVDALSRWLLEQSSLSPEEPPIREARS